MAAPETTNNVTVRKLTSLMSKLWTKIKNALQGKQDALGISSSGDTTKFLNKKGEWATPAGTGAKHKSYYSSDSLRGVKFATTTVTTNNGTAYGVFQFTRLQIGTGIKTLSGDADKPIFGIVQIFHRTNGSGETVAGNVMARITVLQSDFTGQIRVYFKINGTSVDWYIATTTTRMYVSWRTLKLLSTGTVDDIELSGVNDVSAFTENNASYKTPLVAAESTGTGSSTNPVYVDGDGQVQACSFDEAYKSITQLVQPGTGYDTTTTVINSTHILQATLSSYVINIKRLKVGQVYKFMFLEGSNSGQVYLCNGNGSNFSYVSGPNGGTTKKLSLNGGSHGSSYTSYVIRDSDTSVYHIWGY